MSNELKTDSVPDIDAQRNEELDPESVRKRYESMSFDEVTQHMAESYRQLTEVLGKRISTPSAASSDKTTDTPLYDIPDDDDFDDERIVERNDLDDVVKKQKMSKLLARAASSGDVCKVKQLLSDERLRAYIDVDAKDEDGATPLIYAACFGKVEIAQSLLKAGAKTDIQDSSGWSALMWATTNNHEGLVKVLLEYGASAQTRSSRGRTVFDFVNNDNHKIGEILATNPRDSVSSTSSFFGRTTVGSQSSCSSVAGDYDFYYQSTVEGFDNFMVEDAERRQKLMETAMALVGSSQNMDDEADDNEDDDDYKYEDMEEDFDDNDQPNEFHWDKCMPDQMFVFSADDLERILDTAIVNVELPVQSRRDICAPADIVFLSARFAHYFSSDELLHQVLDGALQRIVKITKENARSVHSLSFWLTNIVQLLYYLKKDSGLVVASADYQLRLSEMISEVYTMLINDTERRLYKIIGPAMLEYEQIPGMEDVDFADDWQRFFRRNSRRSIIVPPDGNLSVQMRRHSSQPVHTGTLAPQSVVSVLSSTFYVLQAYEVHPAIIIQALAQFFHFLSCETFNRILTNKKMLSRSKALQIRMNMSYVEDWIRNNRLPSSLLSYLNPTIQLLQLLQCLSQLSDLETFVQTIKKFDSLNALQIRRCVVNYRYEVNEQHLSEDIIYYVTQLADDLVRYKQARKPSKVRRTATTLSRVSSLSMRRSISRPESMSSFMGSIMSSRNSASSMSLPSTPVTENPAAMPSKLASKENETELDDHDIAEIRDSRFMLPFSVPTTAHMVSTNGWAPDNSKDRLVTPAIPESWMEKLDKPTASDDDA